MRREHDLAEHHARHAVDLNPNDANAMITVGDVLARRGQPQEALEWINKAKRLNPYHPPFYDSALAVTLYAMRCYREAVQVYNRLPGLHPWLRAGLAASLAQAGQKAAAQEQVRLLLQALPAGATYYVNSDWPYELEEDRDHFHEGLILAGLPV